MEPLQYEADAALDALIAYDAETAYDADKAFDPLITPVVVIAPDELIDISVVEPLTNRTFPVGEICMTLVRFDAD